MATLSKNDFLKGLKKSGVLETDQLIEWVREANLDTPQQLAAKLVKDKLLTRWQAKFLLTGRTRLDIGSYRLLERIQKDDLGDRFLALHTSLARKVEIQVLPAAISKDETRFKPFIQQASKTATLDHPNLVHVYDIDQEGGRYFLVTEHFEGDSLAQQTEKSVSQDVVAKLTLEILQGLQHAHENGVIHGSIEPDDVVFTKRGEIKLNHIAISPLRKILKDGEQNQVTPTTKSDFSALSKLGLKLLSKVPEKDLDQSYLSLTKIINSFADGESESVLNAIEKLEAIASEQALAPTQNTDDSTAGGFDSPVPTELSRKVKKPTDEGSEAEPAEEEEMARPPGLISTFWQANPVAFIATIAIVGLGLIGGSAFGVYSLIKQPDELGAVAEKETKAPAGTSKTSLTKKAPNLDDPSPTLIVKKNGGIAEDQATAMIAKALGDGGEVTNDLEKPERNQKENVAVYKDLRIKTGLSKNGVLIPAETSLQLVDEKPGRGMKVEFTLAGGQPQRIWLKTEDVYDAGAAGTVAGDGALSVDPAAVTPVQTTPAKEPNTPAVVSANLPDEDLEKIYGVGPTTKKVFYDAGIRRFDQLGKLTPEDVKKIAANTRIAFKTVEDFKKWIAEARTFAGMPAAADSGSAMTGSTPAKAAPKAASNAPATTPKTVANEPLKALPREVQLPIITNLEEVSLTPLVIRRTHRLGAEILSEPGIAKQKLIFELTRGDKATGNNSNEEKQRWLVGVKRRAKEDPENFAEFRKSEDKFHFKWLPEAEKNRYAEYLRNCKLRLKLPDESQTVISLRKPMPMADLRLTEEKLENKVDIFIPAIPTLESVVVEVLPLKVPGTETTVNISQVEKGVPAEIWLKKNDKTGFLRIYVGGEFKSNKLTLQSNLVFWDRPRNAHFPIKSKDAFAALTNRFIQEKNAATNLFNQKNKDNKLPKYKKEEFEKAMKSAAARSELMTEYAAIFQKVLNQPISVRVYSKLGKTQLMLVETDPKMEQPTNKKKRK